MNPEHNCRPLIQLVYATGLPSYLDLPYNYSLDDLQPLASYLAPCVKMVGVDFANSAALKKTRYRLVAVQGTSIKDQQVLKFINLNQIVSVSLQMSIAIPLPANPILGDIITQVSNSVNRNLLIFHQDPQTNQFTPLPADQMISSKQLEQGELMATIRVQDLPDSNDKPVRVFTNTISVPIVLYGRQPISQELLRDMIAKDLSQSVNIMVSNEMFRRKISQHVGVVPLQNYFRMRDSEDREFGSFVSDLPRPPAVETVPAPKQQTKTSSQTSPQDSPPLPQKQPAQQGITLVLALLLLVVTYAYLKMRDVI